MTGHTHVLAWTPPFLLAWPAVIIFRRAVDQDWGAWLSDGGGGGGEWSLQTRANYDAGTPAADWYVSDLPREAAPADLSEFVTGELGCPVTLTPGTETIRRHRSFGRWHTVPIYYVTAGGQS